ncbi:MAG TPA: FAD:protein FMN transferase, partial [Clostridia bacterium]|nr:FAD:protein FMN transferase [Clostridia bacterium]
KHNNSVWKIGIQSPEDSRGNYLGVVELVDKAVVTSGKYERYFMEDGVRYHHILDTEDGFPIEKDLASVSIISADATEADALSTLVFGLGLKKGLEFTEQLPGVDSILVTEDNTVFTTSGLRTSFELTDKDFKRGESKALLKQD